MGSLSGGVFRPRGALARTLYDKHQNDCKLRTLNKMDWYRCDLQLVSERIRSRFHQLSPDEDTRSFIASSIDKSSWFWTQLWHSLVKSFLGMFMTKTDINGWLGRGSMFVLSLDQLTRLIETVEPMEEALILEDYCVSPTRLNSLIDIGAGDGEVTLRWSPIFSQIYATEISSSMRRLLEAKSFKVLDAEDWWTQDKFDVVSMLNLLDRCSEPHSMMLSARQALSDDGLLIIALVLPFKPYVEYTKDHKPSERLPIRGKSFEEQAESFINYVRDEIDLEIAVWARVPYLCEGDMNQSYYWLDDGIFIFKKTDSE